jgi:hypothetical protein
MATKVTKAALAPPKPKKAPVHCATCKHPPSFHPKVGDSPSANRGGCLVGGCKCSRYRKS